MRNLPVIVLGKSLSRTSRILNRGNGSTWPGHIALSVNPHFIKDLLKKSKTKIILVAGTNGKTTTSALIKTGLVAFGKTVLQNESGANLLNGVASTLLLHTTKNGKLKEDYAIFEIDENALPLVLKELTPDYLILLNLFRDQLDRYGEVNSITKKWQEAIKTLPPTTTLVLNTDDPQIATLGITRDKRELYFGVTKKQQEQETNTQHGADTLSCPRCGEPLQFSSSTFSHLGKWHCAACGLTQPKAECDRLPESASYPLPGTYNAYNTHAAYLVLSQLGMNDLEITHAFSHFTAAFGRQEIITFQGKQLQLFLSKNPTSFTQSYNTIRELGGKTLLIALNDRIPDGRDVSWIWDIELTDLTSFKEIFVTGDRVYDMALLLKYNDFENVTTFTNVHEAITTALAKTDPAETLYVLPTYSAMLEVRKIVTGKKDTMNEVTFLTGNSDKVAWTRRYLTIPLMQKKLDLPEIQSLDAREVAEDKLKRAYAILKTPVLIEDTSLVFHALGKLPGPFIKWFLKELECEGLCKLITTKDRSATATVTFGLYDGKTFRFYGASVEGTIPKKPRGKNGFGWDSIFVPKGSQKTHAEMSKVEMDKFNMRKIALASMQRDLT